MKIGAQFYTLRNAASTLDGFADALARVADMGYTTVQISGTCGYEPEWLAEQLKKNGLICALTHTSPDRIRDDTAKVAAEHKIFGCNYVGVGCMPGLVSPETTEKYIKEFVPAAKTLKENGCKLFYHNHHWEFSRLADGRLVLDHLMEAFPPELMSFTLDTYWAQYGGADPAQVIERLAGRGECIHLKDLIIVGNEQRMAPVGAGNLNFDRIIAAAEKVGSEYLLVEQDNCYEEDPFDCLKKSYEYLHAMGLN